MKTVHVTASKNYEVKIGSGILNSLAEEMEAIINPKIVCIVSDSNVWPIYGEKVREILLKSGNYYVTAFIFPAGESSKNGETYLSLLNYLAECKLTRSDCLIALGGGVVGDLTGFAAATYLRGISFIQVPTTLLAAVDSSVGGKTAIDLPAGKNLAGVFYQPSLVLCDTDTLSTLPKEVFRDGCAEVIKYGILYDEDLFTYLCKSGLSFDQESVITRCVELKRDVVAKDEFDNGERQKLNLGHTVGHGIEAKSDFAVSHGKAVAIGMAIVSRAAEKLGIAEKQSAQLVLRALRVFCLPENTPYSAHDLYTFALSDKKRSGGSVNLIVPINIGKCIILPMPVDDLQNFIEAGM